MRGSGAGTSRTLSPASSRRSPRRAWSSSSGIAGFVVCSASRPLRPCSTSSLSSRSSARSMSCSSSGRCVSARSGIYPHLDFFTLLRLCGRPSHAVRGPAHPTAGSSPSPISTDGGQGHRVATALLFGAVGGRGTPLRGVAHQALETARPLRWTGDWSIPYNRSSSENSSSSIRSSGSVSTRVV